VRHNAIEGDRDGLPVNAVEITASAMIVARR